MNSVTVVGSINIDLISYLDRWPEIGETIKVRETSSSLGGKGANQAVAASRLGANVTLIGAVGSDGFGQEAKEHLRNSGVQVRVDEVPDVTTGLAFIDVGPDGDNMIRLSSGANSAASSVLIAFHAEAIRNSDVVLLQNEIGLPASLEAARLAREAGRLVVMDPAPAPAPAWDRKVFACFDILTPNAQEAGILVGNQPTTLTEAQQAAQTLRGLGLRGVIVTMGEKGAAWSFDGTSGVLPALDVQSIDTVAAGDCFNGALATQLAKGNPMDEAVAFAMRAAALATTRKGASDSLPTLSELEEFHTPVFA
ncbi:MAG: ribokinase [Roseibium sp.]|uniref:ribokinase n=1 Tax=Roseibium sp. TaxID=1936156 RepID=UPI00261F7C79|nr:ribokinase [Roseibium sp.]MCV0426034.1 ribokinase [Roseibium sp.]